MSAGTLHDQRTAERGATIARAAVRPARFCGPLISLLLLMSVWGNWRAMAWPSTHSGWGMDAAFTVRPRATRSGPPRRRLGEPGFRGAWSASRILRSAHRAEAWASTDPRPRPISPVDRTPFPGDWMYWHKSGQKSGEGQFASGKEVGTWTFWYENGQKHEQGEYENGKAAGTWTRWRENGKMKTEGRYADGEYVGVWIYWHENGQKAEEGQWVDGKKVGTWTSWHENGQMHEQGNYASNWKAGVWTTWYKNGQKLAEDRYANGGRVVQARLWDEKGQEVTIPAPP